jgi:ABC-type polysaccharide/polyol phosphate transport system ATPase subunit
MFELLKASVAINADTKRLKDWLVNPLNRTSTTYPLLADVSLKIGRGEIVGVVGPNGSGKTSLLRLLAGVYEPTSGAVHRVGRVRPLLNLSYCLFEDLSGRDNIEVIARNYGMYERSNAERLVADVIDFSELGEQIDRPVRTYSDGMRLRLCFAVLTHGAVENVVIDEVVSVGDTGFSQKAKARLNNFLLKADCVIVSSHSTEMIDSWCTRKIEMKGGRVVSDTRVA